MALVIFIAFAYVDSLWSQAYLEEIQNHWSNAPIVDVLYVNLKD